MEKVVRMAMLYDQFGELLTAKQRDYFEMYYSENLSLSEIAENEGISRQGVRDILLRTENILEDFEAKTGFAERSAGLQSGISELEGLLRSFIAGHIPQSEESKLTVDRIHTILSKLKDLT